MNIYFSGAIEKKFLEYYNKALNEKVDDVLFQSYVYYFFILIFFYFLYFLFLFLFIFNFFFF